MSKTYSSFRLLPPLRFTFAFRLSLLGFLFLFLAAAVMVGGRADAPVFHPVGTLAFLAAIRDGHALAHLEVVSGGAVLAPGRSPSPGEESTDHIFGLRAKLVRAFKSSGAAHLCTRGDALAAGAGEEGDWIWG